METKINWHSVRTIALVVVMFVVGGLQVIKGSVPFGPQIDTLLPILLFLEHWLQGNSGQTQ